MRNLVAMAAGWRPRRPLTSDATWLRRRANLRAVPRISGDSLQQHREQLQQRVFEAFAELMAERSFDAISMAAIAERAELGRTSIYHHFPDKESVVVAFASHETEQYLTRLLAALTEADDAGRPAAPLRELPARRGRAVPHGPRPAAVRRPRARVAPGDPRARRRGRGRAARHHRGRRRRRRRSPSTTSTGRCR